MKKLFLIFLSLSPYLLIAQEDSAKAPAANSALELAKKLANPISSLISVPFQNNLDVGNTPYNGSKYLLNIQPVIPFTVKSKLNIITRLILPIVSQRNVTGLDENQSGLGDLNLQLFLSPVKGKVIWGAGPAVVFPTATNKSIGSRKWGMGPTAVALYQAKGMTVGMLFNQLFFFAGYDNRADFNISYFQPFFAYNFKSGAGVGIVSEMTENWTSNTFTGYITPNATMISKFGKQMVQFQIGPRFGLTKATIGKWGFRAAVVLLFPK